MSKFETRYIDRVVEIVRSNHLHHSINTMGCTGGGAYKYSSLFESQLGIQLIKLDELDCLMTGLQFVLLHVVGECYTYCAKPLRTEEKFPRLRSVLIFKKCFFSDAYANLATCVVQLVLLAYMLVLSDCMN